MKTCRVHIMGASGAGVTSLGRALADALAVPHHDTDDYFWRPTTPPYREQREVADRLRLMREMFLDRPDWILSGSLDGWGAPIVPLFDHVVFVYVPTAIRLERLRARESRRLGAVADSDSMNPADGRIHRVGLALRRRYSRGAQSRAASGVAGDAAVQRSASRRDSADARTGQASVFVDRRTVAHNEVTRRDSASMTDDRGFKFLRRSRARERA